MKKAVVVTLALIVAALVAGVGVYLLVIRPPLELARSTADGFKQFFNFTPQVTVNETVVIEQSTPIAELATISRKVYVETDWSHTWLHSTKRIVLRGVFEAKAGFDLHQPFSVTIHKDPPAVTARMPRAKILSLQLDDYHVVSDENGWWNKISSDNREEAFRTMQEDAYAKAISSGILEESERTVEQRIREIIGKAGGEVTIQLFDPGAGADR